MFMRSFYSIFKLIFLLSIIILVSNGVINNVLAQNDLEILFQDNFEEGPPEQWELEAGWQIVEELDGNHDLSGEGHYWASPLVEGWSNYEIQARFQIISGGFHLSFRIYEKRVSDTEVIFTRYFLGIHTDGLYLEKQIGSEFISLNQHPMQINQNEWYSVSIFLDGNSITVSINEDPVISFIDSNEPLLFGSFGFETLDGSHALIDDVLILGEPQPTDIPGYSWIKTGGPSGGLGYDVRIHPQNKEIMFVTDNPSGVNKSIDGGTTWTQSNEGITTRTGPSLDGIPIFSLTIDPVNPNIVWAGTQNAKGIYKSIDGGEIWVKKDNGVTESNAISFRNFGIHPLNSNIVFGGAEISTGILGIAFDKTRGKIYKTEDGGENWLSVWEGDNLVRFILFNYDEPQTLYASTGIFDREAFNDEGVGILKSTDGGTTWFPINNGIPNSEGNRFIGFLEMHPTNPTILFAASGNNAKGQGGIFRTLDGGQTWEKVLSNDIYTVVTFSPSNPQIIYAGSAAAFYRSEDMGDTWQKFWKENEEIWGPPGIRAGVPISAVVDPDDPFTVFANNYGGGNFKSIDGSETWVDASSGYTGAHLHDIAIDPNNSATVYTIGRSGPFRSYNAGIHWEGIGFSPATFAEWNANALNPQNASELLLTDEHMGVILKSTDGGTSWREVFKHPDVTEGDPQHSQHGFKAIVYGPSNPNIVYAGMRKSRRTIDGDFPAEASFGMYKSIDGGETWFEINNGLQTSFINIHCISIHPTNALKSNGLISSDVRSLAIDPEEPNILYAGLGEGGGIYKSTDGGEFWGEINLGLQLICPPQLLPIGRVSQGMSLEDPPARFVGADYYSIPWTSVWDIVIDPANTQTIYAADHHSGVYLSTDGGANWNPINEELTTKAVTAMAISSDGEVLYAATEGGGVFRLGLCECEGNFDGDLDVDAEDVNEFLSHFGRSQFFNPCTNQDPCSGDFTCDADVDADDVTKFLEDFGRSQFFNPCPMCTRDPWCVLLRTLWKKPVL
jgi:photosystem II stability/assembly factor-like uncharacterized protein